MKLIGLLSVVDTNLSRSSLYMTGEYGVCTLKDIKLSKFKITKPAMPLINSISYDGCYMAVTDGYRRNVIYVIDVIKKTPCVNVIEY